MVSCLPDRRIRDRATKALVIMVRNKPTIAINLLTKFEACDDDYITERLLIAVYGAFLLNYDSTEIQEIAEYLYKMYFQNETTHLNVIIRDHARLLIELALKRGFIENLPDMSVIRPPYWSNEIIIDLRKEFEEFENDEVKYPGLHIGKMWELSSEPSDFARYIAEYLIRDIIDVGSNQLDFKNIYNGFYSKVFDLGYPGSNDGCAEFDQMISEKFIQDRTRKIWAERLGKKYNRIVLSRFLGQLNDDKTLAANEDSPHAETRLQALNLRHIDPSDIRHF